MPSSSQRSAGEVVPAVPIFSYAQAAKGKAVPSQETADVNQGTAGLPERAEGQDSEETPKASPINHFTNAMAGKSKDEEDKNSSPSCQAVEDVPKKPQEADKLSRDGELPEAALIPQSSEYQGRSGTAAGTLSSTPPSPDYGATSASTLHRDDDASATPNASSESTWDRISQSSQTEEKIGAKVNEEDDGKLSTWEHVPPPQMKDAPPPTVNVWLKRAEAKVLKDFKYSRSQRRTKSRSHPSL